MLRFLALNVALGAATGIALASLIVLTDLAGLGRLIAGDRHPYLAMLLLYAGFALTSAGVVTGAAVMRLPWGKPCDMRDPPGEEIGEADTRKK
jgi:hypothetical protein